MRQSSEQNSFCFLCGACSTGFPHCLHRGISSISVQTSGCLRQYDLTVFCGSLVTCAINLYPYPRRCSWMISSISCCTMPSSYLGTNWSFSTYGHGNYKIGRYESKKIPARRCLNRFAGIQWCVYSFLAVLICLHLTNQMFRRTGDQRGDIDLRGGQYIHRRSGELCGSLFKEQLTELYNFVLG